MQKFVQKYITFVLIAAILVVGIGGYFWYTQKNQPASPTKNPPTTLTQDEQDALVPEEPIQFTNSGPAPEFVGLTNWVNTGEPESESQTESQITDTQKPTATKDKSAKTANSKKVAKPVAPSISINDLKDKVGLITFWTYSCIDCTKLIPYISKWGKEYKDEGLVSIGIHTPQFAFEKVSDNFTNAVKAQKIQYPVAQDNDYKTWSAYHTQFWPTTYLIDRSGTIVYTQIGGGKYGQLEKAVRTVLGLEGEYKTPDAPIVDTANKTSDMFTGLLKLSAFGGTEKPSPADQIYIFPKKLGKNKFALEGSWKFDQESLIHTQGYSRVLLNFNASQAFMVASSPEPVTVSIYIDDKLAKGIIVKDRDLYQLLDSLTPGEHTLRLEIPDQDLQIFSFTFG